MPPSGQILHGAKVPASAYQCTSFQLPSSISFGDMEGVPKLKLGAVDLPRHNKSSCPTPHALQGAANIYNLVACLISCHDCYYYDIIIIMLIFSRLCTLVNLDICMNLYTPARNPRSSSQDCCRFHELVLF